MAKNNEAQTEVPSTEVPAAAAPATDQRSIVLTLKDGSTKKRTDYIRERWATKTVTRAQIAAELTELQGKKVPYQVVFAATKGLEGGAPKAEPAVTAGTEAAPVTGEQVAE